MSSEAINNLCCNLLRSEAINNLCCNLFGFFILPSFGIFICFINGSISLLFSNFLTLTFYFKNLQIFRCQSRFLLMKFQELEIISAYLLFSFLLNALSKSKQPLHVFWCLSNSEIFWLEVHLRCQDVNLRI